MSRETPPQPRPPVPESSTLLAMTEGLTIETILKGSDIHEGVWAFVAYWDGRENFYGIQRIPTRGESFETVCLRYPFVVVDAAEVNPAPSNPSA